jgi:hypothetical protein
LPAPWLTETQLDYLPNISCFCNELLGAAMLMLVVCAITDASNGPPPAGMNPLVIFITVFGIGACLGAQTAYAINPARDLGPRLMAYMVGYGSEVWTYRAQYWLWCPILGSIVGALLGTGVYDLLIFEGKESIVNTPCVTLASRALVLTESVIGMLRRAADTHMLRPRRSRNPLLGPIRSEGCLFGARLYPYVAMYHLTCSLCAGVIGASQARCSASVNSSPP